MSHYDCKNCGAFGGLEYGTCSKCTPGDVLRAEAKLKREIYLIRSELNAMIAPFLEDAVSKRTANTKKIWEELYQKYHPDNK